MHYSTIQSHIQLPTYSNITLPRIIGIRVGYQLRQVKYNFLFSFFLHRCQLDYSHFTRNIFAYIEEAFKALASIQFGHVSARSVKSDTR